VESLAQTLSYLDPDNAYFYLENATAYILELMALDRSITEVVSHGTRTFVAFGDRFPFRHLAAHYGLTYIAAFDGCSSETQVSPVRVASIIEAVQSNGLPVVFYIEFSNRDIANVIVEATGARPLELHSVHNVSPSDFTAGVTYLELMTRNVERLREALN